MRHSDVTSMNSTRRLWLTECLALTTLAEIAAAQEHARQIVATTTAVRFENFDAETAAEIEAITGQIIPSGDGPGAREAGVVYFIDRALSTFASEERASYRAGLAAFEETRKKLFPQSKNIARLTDEQQVELMRAVERSEFFELLRTHTVLGFLGNPSYGGNRDRVGWKHIGFDDRMSFQHPFGYYDNGESEAKA